MEIVENHGLDFLMSKKLLAIASLCAFSLAACESTGSVKTDLADTYRLHTPDGVIETSDPEIIASYRKKPGSTIVAIVKKRTQNAFKDQKKSETKAP